MLLCRIQAPLQKEEERSTIYTAQGLSMCVCPATDCTSQSGRRTCEYSPLLLLLTTKNSRHKTDCIGASYSVLSLLKSPLIHYFLSQIQLDLDLILNRYIPSASLLCCLLLSPQSCTALSTKEVFNAILSCAQRSTMVQ